MVRKLIETIVRFCAGHPWLVIIVAIALAAGSGYYTEQNFALNTDINQLLSPTLPWRQREIAYLKEFPAQQTAILAVVDGPTPEITQEAAQKLTEELNHEPRFVRSASQTQGGPFFEHNGLLYLPLDQVEATLKQLTRSKSFLEALAADPSLRGIISAISLTLRGVRAHIVPANSLAPQFNALAAAMDNALAGTPAYFSWQEFFSGEHASPQETQRFVEIDPVIDYKALEPGQAATNAIHKTAADLNMSGVSVHLTGTIPISDDELGSLKQGAATNLSLTIFAVLVILWLALHSIRIIVAVFVSLFIGLCITVALGLVMVGSFNPISVAFFVLFVGIGVDFGLQFSVSYRAERYEHGDLYVALRSAASSTGARLALAAAATAAGFLSFAPTAYEGLSELGEIAGVGMIVAFLMSITVLPAMLGLLNPPPEPRPLGYSFLAPLDRFLERHRISVLVLTICVIAGASPLLYWVHFDFNPISLDNPNTESVKTYLALRQNPNLPGRSVEILAPSLPAADAMAKKLDALPEVERSLTLSSFIPGDQDQKLSLIAEAAKSLDGVLNPPQVKPTPTEAETIESLESASASLSAVARQAPATPGGEAADRLAKAFAALAKASPEIRAKAASVLISPLKITLNDLRQSLQAEKVTLANLPKSIVSSWLAPDGKARVSVMPRGDSNNDNVLWDFVSAVLKVAPDGTGEAVGIVRGGETVVQAFIEAGIWALASIAFLLWLALRHIRDVALTLFPLILAGITTLELTVVFGMPLNYANIIALPVLLGVGVAFKIYYIMAWREGRTGLLASPLTRAVFFSGMTTAVGFGSLMFSNLPGTASMGRLLALSLACTMAAAVLFQPLLMGPPRHKAEPEEERKEPAYLGSREHTS
ncbi:MAG: MMPL family transporter [Rhodomicrobium sp.]